MQQEFIDISLIDNNEGQVEGLPKNPRFIKDREFESLVRSVEQDPDMLELRELIVFPYLGRYVTIGGNMRLRVGQELAYEEMPCKVLPLDTPIEKLKRLAMKDNGTWGSHDWDALANEWDDLPLDDYGLNLPSDWLEAEPLGDELINQPKKKPATMKITFQSPQQLQEAEIDIQELLDRKFEGAFLFLSTSER